jgi:hypothetical protein
MLKQDTVCPNFSQKKTVLQNCLTQHNIPFSATDTKKVFYEKIKQKKTPVVYKKDKIANLHGHSAFVYTSFVIFPKTVYVSSLTSFNGKVVLCLATKPLTCAHINYIGFKFTVSNMIGVII